MKSKACLQSLLGGRKGLGKASERAGCTAQDSVNSPEPEIVRRDAAGDDISPSVVD